MSTLTRSVALVAAFLLPPLAAALIGYRALAGRDHPAPLAPMTAERLARVPRPELDSTRSTVVVLLGADLTEITDALAPYEMFARTGRFDVVTAAPERQPTLLSGGLRILPHFSLSELDAQLRGRAPAIVIVPNIPNIAEAQNAPLVRWMQRQLAAGAIIHSWCKGAMALAHAGFLDGRTATAHWGDIPTLEETYPRVEWVRGVRWLDHGQIVMSAGITSGIDASLHLIGRLAGDSAARRVAREMRYPNYHFAIDPSAEQLALRPADLVLLANAAFHVGRPRVGVALYPGVGEIDLSNVYDAHIYTMAADVETLAERDSVVTTAHGLTLLPSVTLSTEQGVNVARDLDRLLVAGVDGRDRGASLSTAFRRATALDAEYLHADSHDRFGLEPVIEDLARTSDVATAVFALRRMEYRTSDIRFEGDRLPWRALTTAMLLGALGILLVLGGERLADRRRLLAPVTAALVTLSPVALPGQSAESIAPGSRVRIDLHRTDVSRVRRIFAQPVTGTLVRSRGDTLFLIVREGAGPLSVPRSAARDLFVSRGRPGRLSSALRSAIAPALAGAALRGLGASVSRREGDPPPARAALAGAASSAAFAGLMGAIFPKERWQRIVATTPNRGTARD